MTAHAACVAMIYEGVTGVPLAELAAYHAEHGDLDTFRRVVDVVGTPRPDAASYTRFRRAYVVADAPPAPRQAHDIQTLAALLVAGFSVYGVFVIALARLH